MGSCDGLASDDDERNGTFSQTPSKSGAIQKWWPRHKMAEL
jgi:hypothetical protein